MFLVSCEVIIGLGPFGPSCPFFASCFWGRFGTNMVGGNLVQILVLFHPLIFRNYLRIGPGPFTGNTANMLLLEGPAFRSKSLSLSPLWGDDSFFVLGADFPSVVP